MFKLFLNVSEDDVMTLKLRIGGQEEDWGQSFDFQTPEGPTFICLNDRMQAQRVWECPESFGSGWRRVLVLNVWIDSGRNEKLKLVRETHYPLTNVPTWAERPIREEEGITLYVLWSDESKTEPFAYYEHRYIWRRKPWNSLPAGQYDGGGIMLWGCFAKGGTGALHTVPLIW